MCDCDWPVVCEHGFQKARKSHKCVECGNPIDIGEEYWKIRGLWDGEWATYKMCKSCKDLADIISSEGICFCYGELFERAEECGFKEMTYEK